MYFQNLLTRFRHHYNSTVRYLSCAMTYIDPHMEEDSLLFLDVCLVQNCNSALAKDSHKILPNFLGIVNYRKLCTGTRSIMPFVNLDEDMISTDNCEKETLPIERLSSTLSQLTKLLKTYRICIFGDIMLNSNLNELHKIFESFVTTLPSLLLKPNIDDIVIRM
ncbi:hypothetical protein ALC57_03272 [Trachymyrmex cornetzi]|uniref:Pre-rRNA-processing protein Ipi1 N-terminal domain-containing protein n=1 Tax=Trachymyrmex cornetzi TaxID=471704 RepID=A0A151JMC0_9HYME|nr:hypothetical protein ALC57_03272 [Trachymyrmex cornetzi]